jgi:hypothetical protein
MRGSARDSCSIQSSPLFARRSKGSNGVRAAKNHRHLTHLGDANPSACAVNGGFEFLSKGKPP